MVVASLVGVVAIATSGALAALSYARGTGWKQRAEAAESYQRGLKEQLDRSEEDVKGLEGRLSTLASASAKRSDLQAYADAVVSSVGRLATGADALKSLIAGCSDAIDALGGVAGTDPAAPIDAAATRSAIAAVARTCGPLRSAAGSLRDEIDQIGQ